MKVQKGRIFELTPGRAAAKGPVVYWMSREQRVSDNWALLHAREIAAGLQKELWVVFVLVPGFEGATFRQYDFMLTGLEEVEEGLANLGFPFFLLEGEPGTVLPEFLTENQAGIIICDFDPLRIKAGWKAAVAEKTSIPLIEVDAHNIVPCRIAYPKAAFSAGVLRPRIRGLLGEYLIPVPGVQPIAGRKTAGGNTDWKKVRSRLIVDRSVSLPSGVTPGSRAAEEKMDRFLNDGLERYAQERNDPAAGATSALSAYLHFGQLSAQRLAIEVTRSGAARENKDAFLEELIVRRELADNFCFYQPGYDSFDGFHSWARQTLDMHRRDEREYLYSLEDWENGQTHDRLWNAAQKEAVQYGSMHGYMRMYWAKKILEWSSSPEEALRIAIYLNDRYQLDGRDPNGYTGIAWSIGGVHDRAWQERPVTGKIRYMNENGCRRKFDVEKYISMINN